MKGITSIQDNILSPFQLVLFSQIEPLSDVNSSNYQQSKTYQELEGNETALGTFEQVVNNPPYK